jgi:hypothetical protein
MNTLFNDYANLCDATPRYQHLLSSVGVSLHQFPFRNFVLYVTYMSHSLIDGVMVIGCDGILAYVCASILIIEGSSLP